MQAKGVLLLLGAALAAGAVTEEGRRAAKAYASAPPAPAPVPAYGDSSYNPVTDYDVKHKQCNQKICGTYAEECKTYCAAYQSHCTKECVDYKKGYYVERTGVNKQSVKTCAQYETRQYKECVEFEKKTVNVCAGTFISMRCKISVNFHLELLRGLHYPIRNNTVLIA